MNSRTRHFKDLQLTFFGLIVKANGIMDRMLWQAEFLQENNKELKETYEKLKKTKKRLDKEGAI